MTEKTYRLEFTPEEAMWVWRVMDVMTDLSGMSTGLVMMESREVNQRLGETACQVRDELSAQGMSGDG